MDDHRLKLKGIWKGTQTVINGELGHGEPRRLEYTIKEEPHDGQKFFLYEKGVDSGGDYETMRTASLDNRKITWTDNQSQDKGEIDVVGSDGMSGKYIRANGSILKEYLLKKVPREGS